MDPSDIARRAIGLIDLTSLNEDDTEADIRQLCDSATTPAGNTAAVCVYPRFVGLALECLARAGAHNIRVATVTNFPAGSDDVKAAVAETRRAARAGAHEVDVVFPFRAFMAGDRKRPRRLVAECREVCDSLKVILETGVIQDPGLIRQASDMAIEAGADFIKTSTGKVAVNATPEAARVMLESIRDSGGNCGFKASGGIRSTRQAAVYLTLAEDIMGPDWISARHFRFGASGLLQELLAELGIGAEDGRPGGY